jgi:dihydrofolate synthase / folylpolyglutamate synthase
MTPRERLAALEQFGIKLGLENINKVLEALNRPERAFPTVHVAGTNGKGSVTAMVECGLRSAGHTTGRYTSPHLDRIEERVAINGEPVDAAVFDAAATDVIAAIDRLHGDGTLENWPTFFEATTAIAFEVFRRCHVTVGVIEVGLGGRFDATNVITPVVSAITSIALDHERHLGHTIPQIAFEKAGIIKAGVPVVVGELPSAAMTVVAAEARERGAPMITAGYEHVEAPYFHKGRATLVLRTPEGRYPPIRLALNGPHQVANALVAVRTLEVCGEHGLDVTAGDVASALSEVEWPARLEWLRTDGGRWLLLDAAHNPAGAESLATYLTAAGLGRLPMVVAVMQDKNIDRMLEPLASVASLFVTTEVASTRSLTSAALAARIALSAPQIPVVTGGPADEALAIALHLTPRIVVTGSLFLVGPMRARLVADGAVHVDEVA